MTTDFLGDVILVLVSGGVGAILAGLWVYWRHAQRVAAAERTAQWLARQLNEVARQRDAWEQNFRRLAASRAQRLDVYHHDDILPGDEWKFPRDGGAS